jgi:outer membrane immunogenic protein
MKSKILGSLCVGALFFASGPAMAEEGTAAYKSSWTGFRAGIVGAYGWGQADISAVVQGVSEDGSADLTGGMIGGLLGYDYDIGNGIVLGIVGDLSWSGLGGEGCIRPSGVSCSVSQSDMSVDLEWLGTARLRAGYAVDDILIYGTGGVAFGGVDASINSPLLNGSESQTSIGWTAGVGIDYRISDPVTIGLEYLYVDLGEGSYDFSDGGAAGHGDVDLNMQLLRAHLQWRF